MKVIRIYRIIGMLIIALSIYGCLEYIQDGGRTDADQRLLGDADDVARRELGLPTLVTRPVFGPHAWDVSSGVARIPSSEYGINND